MTLRLNKFNFFTTGIARLHKVKFHCYQRAASNSPFLLVINEPPVLAGLLRNFTSAMPISQATGQPSPNSFRMQKKEVLNGWNFTFCPVYLMVTKFDCMATKRKKRVYEWQQYLRTENTDTWHCRKLIVYKQNTYSFYGMKIADRFLMTIEIETGNKNDVPGLMVNVPANYNLKHIYKAIDNGVFIRPKWNFGKPEPEQEQK